ncbi:MAG TPA: flavodoxin [Natronosporangium sp.]
MRALVVYESMFGNTQAIAEAIGGGLASTMAVEVIEVGAAPTQLADDLDLLVVGGPTHAFSMSRPQTRADAIKQADGPVISIGDGLREWVGRVSGTVAAATFDTRVTRPRLAGSAARAAERRLRRRGLRMVAKPASFYVQGTTGPLCPGETDRARRWGEQLAATVTGLPTAG